MTDRTIVVRACTKKWRRYSNVPAETVPPRTCFHILTGHPPATAAHPAPPPFGSLFWITARVSAWPGMVIKMFLYLCTTGLTWDREVTGQNPN